MKKITLFYALITLGTLYASDPGDTKRTFAEFQQQEQAALARFTSPATPTPQKPLSKNLKNKIQELIASNSAALQALQKDIADWINIRIQALPEGLKLEQLRQEKETLKRVLEDTEHVQELVKQKHIAEEEQDRLLDTLIDTAINNIDEAVTDPLAKKIRRLEIDHEKLAVAIRKRRDALMRTMDNTSLQQTLYDEYGKELAALGFSANEIQKLIAIYGHKAKPMAEAMRFQELLGVVPPAVGKNIVNPLVGYETLFKPYLLQTIKLRESPEQLILSNDGSVLAARMIKKAIIYTKMGTAWKHALTIPLPEAHAKIIMSDDGSIIATEWHYNRTIYARAGNIWKELKQTKGAITMNSDGSVIVIRYAHEIHIYKRTDNALTILGIIRTPVESITVSPDGSVIVTQQGDRALIFASSSDLTQPWRNTNTITGYFLAMNNNGSNIAIVDNNEKEIPIYSREGEQWTESSAITYNEFPTRAQMSNDGSVIAVSNWYHVNVYIKKDNTWTKTTIEPKNTIMMNSNMNSDGSLITISKPNTHHLYKKIGDQWILIFEVSKKTSPKYTMSKDGSLMALLSDNKKTIALYALPPAMSEEILKNITSAQLNFINDMQLSYKAGHPLILGEDAQHDFDALFANLPELRAWLEKRFTMKTLQQYISMRYKRLASALTAAEKKEYTAINNPEQQRAWLQKKARQKKSSKCIIQ